jgi:hypothetical protein
MLITILAGITLNLVRSGWEQIAYPQTFVPSIYVACGYGYGSPVDEFDPQVESFISGDTSSLNCNDVRTPQNLDQQVAYLGTYYQQLTVGNWWRFVGISWQSLDWLTAIFLGIASSFTFLILRLWLSTLFAIIVTGLSVIPALPFLVFPRDLMKAPFILGAIFLAFYIVLRRQKTSSYLVSMFAVGAFLGVGLGFRTDVLVGMALITGTAVFFRQGTGERNRSKRWSNVVISLCGVTILLLSFLFASAPARSKAPETNQTAHWALLGLSDSTQDRQSGADERISIVQHHLDTFNFSIVEAHASYRGIEESFAPYSMRFGENAQDLYLEAISSFPAMHLKNLLFTGSEVLATGASGLIFVADLAKNGVKENNFPASRNTFFILWVLIVLMWVIFVVTLIVLDRRLGLFALFFIAWITFFPMVQFESRHIFYLSFLTWIPIATALDYTVNRHPLKFQSLLKSWEWPDIYSSNLRSRQRWISSGAVVVATVSVFVITYAFSSFHQTSKFNSLLSTYQATPNEPASYMINGNGSLIVDLQGVDRDPWWSVLQISAEEGVCKQEPGNLTVEIHLSSPSLETRVPTEVLTWSRELDAGNGFEIFTPIPLRPEEIRELRVSFVPLSVSTSLNTTPCILDLSWLGGQSAPSPPFTIVDS